MFRSIVSLLLVSGTSQAFVVPSLGKALTAAGMQTKLEASKGFGEKKQTKKLSAKKKLSSQATTQSSSQVSSSDFELTTSPTSENPFPQEARTDISQGAVALEKMRRERAEKRDEELRRMKQLQDIDSMLKESSEPAVIPEKVAQRMGSRMLPFVGLPLFGGMAAFVGFWYMSTYKGVTYEPSVVASTTIALMVAGLLVCFSFFLFLTKFCSINSGDFSHLYFCCCISLSSQGISYSLLSASWDPDRDGSAFGTDEFQRNVGNIKEGLSRSRENAVLRDKMRDVSPEEMEDLARRDGAQSKKKQSFNEKMGGELD